MNVALVNKNPAVSRLITLSLDKVGAKYLEFDEISQLQNKVDFLIIDSDIDIADVNLKEFATKIMYLIPRGSETPSIADVVLEKPFLPTDFITIFEKNKHISEEVPKIEEKDENNTKFSNEFEEEISFELPDFDDINLDKDDQAPAKDTQGDSDTLVDEVKESSADDSKETEDMFKDLPSLDEFHADINTSSTAELEFSELDDALADIDSLSDELNSKLEISDEAELKDTNLDNELDELASVVDEIDTMADDKAVEESSDVSFSEINLDDEQVDSIENIKHILDDIDTAVADVSKTDEIDKNLNESDTALDEFLSDEIDDKESEKGDLNSDSLENLIKDENLNLENSDEAELKDVNLDSELDELISATSDESLNDSEPIANKPMKLDEISEIDSLENENLSEELEKEPIAEVASDKESSAIDELQSSENDEILDDIMAVDESVINDETSMQETDELLEEVTAPKTDDLLADEEIMTDELIKDEAMPTQNQNLEQINNIDDIDEASMMAAFGLESAAAVIKEIKKSDVKSENFKDELSKKITEHIKTSLCESSIKEALKDMNIKINISFEEK